MNNLFKRIRISQIRRLANLLVLSAQLPLLRTIIRGLMHIGPARFLLHELLGYRRPFSSLAEANEFAGHFLASHETQDNINSHLHLGEKARPSDYAALFHLRGLLHELTTILDVGGSAGNLFYCYSRYLTFSPRLRWIVYDLPKTIAIGRELASERGETQLHFVSSLTTEPNVDVMLVSGSLHYFDVPLSALIAQLNAKPKHIIINRTPLSRCASFVTVQDGWSLLTACKVVSFDSVVVDLQSIGYKLVDSWQAPELSLYVPCHPELSIPSYSGMYYRLADPDTEFGR